MTMNILIQDFCNSISESPLPKIKSKAEKSFCLTKPDAGSSGGEEDWLASGQLADMIFIPCTTYQTNKTNTNQKQLLAS